MERWRKFANTLVSQLSVLFVFLVCSLFIVGCGGDKKPATPIPSQSSSKQATQLPNKPSNATIAFFLLGENENSAQDSLMGSLLYKQGFVQVEREVDADLIFAPSGTAKGKQLAEITKRWVVISTDLTVTANSVDTLTNYITQNNKTLVVAKREWGKPDNLGKIISGPNSKDISEVKPPTQAEFRLLSEAEYKKDKDQYKTPQPIGDLTQKRSIYLRQDKNLDAKVILNKLRAALDGNTGYVLSNTNIESAIVNQVSNDNPRFDKIEKSIKDNNDDLNRIKKQLGGLIQSHIELIVGTLLVWMLILTIALVFLFMRGGTSKQDDSFAAIYGNNDNAVADLKRKYEQHNTKVAQLERNMQALVLQLDEHRRIEAAAQKKPNNLANETGFSNSNAGSHLQPESFAKSQLVDTISTFANRVAGDYNNALKDDQKQDEFRARYRPVSYDVANAHDIRQNPLGTLPIFKPDPAGKYMFICFNETNLYLVTPIFKTKVRKVNWFDGAMQITFRDTKGFDETKFYSDVRVVSPAIYSEQNMTMMIQKLGELDLGSGEKIS